MAQKDLAEVRALLPAAGKREHSDGHDEPDAGFGDGEVEQRGIADMVHGEVVPECVRGDERPDQPAPGEPPSQTVAARGAVPAAAGTDRDDGDSRDDGEGSDHLGEGGTLTEEGHGDDDRHNRPDAARRRVYDAERGVIVAGLQGHGIGDVEDRAQRRRTDQTPVQRLGSGGDDDDCDRGEQDR